MPNFTSEKETPIKLGGGVELHTKKMLCNGELTEVRRSLRGEGGTSVTHTNVCKNWFQPVHMHLRTVEATTVLAGCAVSLAFNEAGDYKVVVHKVGSVIRDEIGTRHTLYVVAGTQLSTSKVLTGQSNDTPDWQGAPECDEEFEKTTIERILATSGIDPASIYS